MKSSTVSALIISAVLGTSLVGYTVFSQAGEKSPQRFASSMAQPVKTGDYTIIRYNGGEVRKSDLDQMWKVMFSDKEDAPSYEGLAPGMRMEVLKNIAREHILLDKAVAAHVDQSDEVKNQLDALKRQITIQVYLKNQLNTLVPETKVKEQYATMQKQYEGKEEVKARHILVKTQEEAKEIQSELKNGADFAKLAKEKSEDKGSGVQGGELGYFTKEQMVPEFATAAFKLKRNDISEPVKSDFGWHVIQVEDRRAVQPPKYDDVKQKIQQSLASEAVQHYVQELTDSADVKYYDINGKELEDAPSAPAAGGMTPIPAQAGAIEGK